MKGDFLIRTKIAHEALSVAKQGLKYSQEKSTELHELYFMGYLAEAKQLSGDAEGAIESISQGTEIYKRQAASAMPLFVAPFLTARLLVFLNQLEHAIRSNSSSDITHFHKHTYEAGKAAVKNSKKYAPYRTKILRLMGLYYWLIGKQGKALKWWDRAIKEGERLGAKPDLSRTYFEVGKRLLEPRSKHKELNGMPPKAYLEKAGILFEEMGLERDLEDLDRLRADHGLKE